MTDVRARVADTVDALRRRAAPHTGRIPRVRILEHAKDTAVDRYWTRHTVRTKPFRSARASARYLEWRFSEYPLFREFSGLWGEHGGETVLDYGCGPGNDLTGFAVHTGAGKLIGVDVSQTALDLAAERLALHKVPEDRVELIRVADSDRSIPLADDSIDHLNCQGVLHHTSDPDALLAEFARVLTPGGSGSVMVYNRNSLWFHLWTAYDRVVVERAFPGLDIHEAFKRNTDGEDCPVSRSYLPEDFVSMCRAAGLEADYVGGYLSRHELTRLKRSWNAAIADAQLAPEHRHFLRGLTFDFQGFPIHNGQHAGIGGTYRLRLPVEPGLALT